MKPKNVNKLYINLQIMFNINEKNVNKIKCCYFK